MPGGRPSKINDPKVVRKLLDGIILGMPYEHAADWAGINRQTYYNWYNKGKTAKSGKFKEFFDKVKEAEAKGIGACLTSIHQARGDGNWQAAAWILERRYPGKYGRQRLEVTGKDGKPIKIDANIEKAKELMGDLGFEQVDD